MALDYDVPEDKRLLYWLGDKLIEYRHPVSILVIIILIFGVGKLPEVGQALGKGIREFRGAADGGEDDSQPPAKPAAPAAPRR